MSISCFIRRDPYDEHVPGCVQETIIVQEIIVVATIIAYKGDKVFMSIVVTNQMIIQDGHYFIFELNIQFFGV